MKKYKSKFDEISYSSVGKHEIISAVDNLTHMLHGKALVKELDWNILSIATGHELSVLVEVKGFYKP